MTTVLNYGSRSDVSRRLSKFAFFSSVLGLLGGPLLVGFAYGWAALGLSSGGRGDVYTVVVPLVPLGVALICNLAAGVRIWVRADLRGLAMPVVGVICSMGWPVAIVVGLVWYGGIC